MNVGYFKGLELSVHVFVRLPVHNWFLFVLVTLTAVVERWGTCVLLALWPVLTLLAALDEVILLILANVHIFASLLITRVVTYTPFQELRSLFVAIIRIEGEVALLNFILLLLWKFVSVLVIGG